MRKKLMTIIISLIYLIFILLINATILNKDNFLFAVTVNIIVTLLYSYSIFKITYKFKIDKIENMMDIINEGRYDYKLDDSNEKIISALQKNFYNTKETSKLALNSSVKLALESDKVANMVDNMEESTEQIARTSEEIASGSLKQMESINSIFSNIEGVGSNIDRIRCELKNIGQQTDESVKLTEKGNENIMKTKQSIDSLRDIMIEYNNNLNNFIESFCEIEKFSDIIKGITEHTNLLALNSSIEAARAGEHGKGFAVVATEIGKLSNQSKNASDKISEVIEEIKHKMSELTQEMSYGINKVDEGVIVAQKAEQSFNQISNSTIKTKDQISTINKNMRAIGSYTGKVIESVETIQGISESGASECQQFNAIVEEMNSSFGEIVQNINFLKDYANNLQQSFAQNTMDIYMYNKALDIKRYIDKSEKLDLRKFANELNIDDIYIVDSLGIIKQCSDKDGIGLNSFEIDPISYKASKLKEGYKATPIRKRCHDNEMYKFLHIPYKNGGVISVSLSLQSVLNI
ncbi:MAG: methyl-accepting chemotaxis protein [Tepidibacter sp.]|jgi:methyl-accepting chemotaxis protein|uniref:methyl-accepting chemotaxis protein n=1 Tax=Tepidibacter sp. TaxID=2529387 RepID=UPI0025E0F01E|nr:methyl-accepting chemotaxis protein [Tepidibacter sp.]MCT4509980.1 methyl-accepting chemotaxis protein [Tepidibacter sp.]